MSQEVLETGQERPSRGLPSWLVWTVGLAALILLTAANVVVAGELALRSIEADNLVRAVEQSETAMKTTQAEFDEVLSAYDTDSLTDEEREQLRTELADVATRGAALWRLPWSAPSRDGLSLPLAIPAFQPIFLFEALVLRSIDQP